MNKDKLTNNKSDPKLDWLKNIPKRAGDLYFSLCESQGNAINKNKFYDFIYDAGLSSNDFRLKKIFGSKKTLKKVHSREKLCMNLSDY